MNEDAALLLVIVIQISLYHYVRSYRLRIRVGVMFAVVGCYFLFWPPFNINEFDNGYLPLGIFTLGLGLFFNRNEHRRVKTDAPIHPLLRAPTMNLAPDFPDDPVMHQLMQLLHEEIGLPKHKTISLNTSINFDLGCEGSEARQLMDALEQDFGIDLNDYDAYRYFQPVGFDVYLKRRAKGRGEKAPLTIGMLYQAAKMQRWETEVLEQ